MREYTLRSSHIVQLLGGFLIVAILVLFALTTWAARQQSLATWRSELATLSLMLSEQTSQQLTSAHLVLDSIADRLEGGAQDSAAALEARMRSPAMLASMRDKLRGLPQLRQIMLIDRRGKVLNASSGPPSAAHKLAGREAFQVHLADPAYGMLFSKPVRSLQDGTWTFYLSRRLNRPDGTLAGVAIIGFSVASLSNFYQKMTLGEGAVVSLYRSDFTLLARTPQAAAPIGQTEPAAWSQQLRALMARPGEPVGHTVRIGADGVPAHWMSAPRPVRDHPLAIDISINEALLLARWREFAMLRLLLVGVICVIVVLMSLTLRRLLARHERDRNMMLELKKQAEAASLTKSEFLTLMSHEIRTPLTSIIGFAELLESSSEPAVRAEAGQIIMRNGKHLMSIINGILDIAKIEAGRLDLEQVSFSAAETLWSVDAIMSAQARSKGIEFRTEHIGALPEQVMGDPARWRQILLNLCSHAIKYTELGKVQLTLSYDQATARLLCKVTDTGIGMTAQQCADLFAPFGQGRSAGLGLNLVAQLCARMGGQVQVSSAPGKGSVFEAAIVAPAAPGSAWIDSAPPSREPAGLPRSPPLRLHGRVLLAEDGPDNRALIRAFLVRIGLECTLTENGAQAVERALTDDFDLILMDIQMPVMDGTLATELLRKGGFKGPMVALTANLMDGDIERYLDSGFSHCLAKPLDFERLGELLAELLETQGGGAATQPGLPDFQDIVGAFEAGLPGRLAQIGAWLEAGQSAEAASLAHMLKGSAASFGYPRVTDFSSSMERALQRGDVAGASACLAQMLALDEVRRLL